MQTHWHNRLPLNNLQMCCYLFIEYATSAGHHKKTCIHTEMNCYDVKTSSSFSWQKTLALFFHSQLDSYRLHIWDGPVFSPLGWFFKAVIPSFSYTLDSLSALQAVSNFCIENQLIVQIIREYSRLASCGKLGCVGYWAVSDILEMRRLIWQPNVL